VTDPFAALRAPDVPLDPDPVFAARLRARLERALALPRGVAPMTTTTTPVATSTLTPYLAVADARAAIDWYRDVFGAVPIGDPIFMPDGRIGHAELAIGGARLYLSDAHPELGVVPPQPDAGTSVTLHLELADVDETTERARTGRAVVEREPSDNPYGRIATVRDPFGHRWMLNGPVRTDRGRAIGDVGYFALWVDDVDRAAEFFTAVLGWDFTSEAPTRRRATNAPYRTEVVALAEMRDAFWPRRDTPTAFCARQVEDLDAAAQRVRDAGGRTQPRGHGIIDCVDDQGLPFAIFDDTEDYSNDAIAYLTVEEPSVEAAVAFHELVFDWAFRPGSIPEGRQVDGPTPMMGFAGGASEPAIVPMFAVDDITAAVDRVRAAGGTATDPERYPYGVTSQCTDDQGLRFYLGELG
jgi:uncharacterized glyoxalase superfamily protein PhnB